MIAVLDAVALTLPSYRRRVLGAQQRAVLAALEGGRMLTRAQLRERLGLAVCRQDLSRVLQRLEQRGRIVVDREERPLLYGRLR